MSTIDQVETVEKGDLEMTNDMPKVIVAGAGIAGLVAALVARRHGAEVVVLESGLTIGGRARTTLQQGYMLNQGPHALYCAGVAIPILKSLGITTTGGIVGGKPAFGLYRQRLTPLPTDLTGIMRCAALPWRDKIGFTRAIQVLTRVDPGAFAGLSFDAAMDQLSFAQSTKTILRALARLTTYVAAPDHQCAKATIEQIKLSFSSVKYLHGGWTQLIDQLSQNAQSDGVRIRTESRVESVDIYEGKVRVRLSSGEAMMADKIILATPPAEAKRILGEMAEPRGLNRDDHPARAACLDLALEKLPRPDRSFVLGLDEPYYFSDHTAYADLAPEGGAVIHVAKYLAPRLSNGATRDDASGLRRELEDFLSAVQPGWQQYVRYSRFLPRMPVADIWPEASSHGLNGRPQVFQPDLPNILLAGDWAGSEALLVDAACASGQLAGLYAASAVPTAHQFQMAS
jgi:phytoene dehydrogenase-like protein